VPISVLAVVAILGLLSKNVGSPELAART